MRHFPETINHARVFAQISCWLCLPSGVALWMLRGLSPSAGAGAVFFALMVLPILGLINITGLMMAMAGILKNSSASWSICVACFLALFVHLLPTLVVLCFLSDARNVDSNAICSGLVLAHLGTVGAAIWLYVVGLRRKQRCEKETGITR